MKTDIHFLSYLVRFYQEREIFQTKFVEKIKTHFVFNFFFLNRAYYEIIWKNIVQPDRPHMRVWRMRSTFCIPKAANTYS
jgi:hypothetical protein